MRRCKKISLNFFRNIIRQMRRGLRRGRSINSVSTRGASTRRNTSDSPSTSPTRSTSRYSTLQNSRSHRSVRRSARIAELLNGETHHQLTNATSSMADVARPRALGGRSARPRHHSANPHTSGPSRSGRHSLSPEDIQYAMDIVVQPPRTARVGQTMSGAMIVRLRTTNADPDDAVADSPNLIAVATLVPGPNSTGPADPSVLHTILAGRRVESIHPFADDEADGSIASMDMADPYGVGYVRFPELMIRQAGTYRIRITLIRIASSATAAPVPTLGNGSPMHMIDSNPIVVNGAGQASNLSAYNGKYMVTTY